FRSGRARDRSYFEGFRGIHESLYRFVEPTSVTPWSLASRKRSLAGALVLLLRNGVIGLQDNNSAANFDPSDLDFRAQKDRLIEAFLDHVSLADQKELAETTRQVESLLEDW